MLKKNLIVISLVLLSLSTLLADTLSGDQKNDQAFRKEVSKLSELCTATSCKEPYSKKIEFHYNRKKTIDVKFKKAMEVIAIEQAQIWGDTILEGDYVADGKTRLDQITSLYKNDKLIGYLIRYSEKAWNTSSKDCQYHSSENENLEGCIQGRIIESAYVSLNLKDYFNTEKTWAVFRTNPSKN